MNLQEFDKFIENRKFFTEDFEKELRKHFENKGNTSIWNSYENE